MFAAQESRLVRTASFGISLLIHLLLFLLFPHMATFLEGTYGEGIMAGGVPVQVVALTPVSSSATRPVEVAGYGSTDNAPATRARPAPGEPTTLPQPDRPPGVTLQTPTPAGGGAPVSSTQAQAGTADRKAAILPPQSKESQDAEVRGGSTGLPATPTGNHELLTSPTGTDVVQVPEYSPEESAGVTESKSTKGSQAKSPTVSVSADKGPVSAAAAGDQVTSVSNAAAPQGQSSRAGGEVRNEGTGAGGRQGIGSEPAAPPAPAVGRGPWLAGSAPVYPKAALDRGLEGVVRGQVLINAAGQITVRKISSAGHPNMDLVATKTIGERWQATYRPPEGWVTVVEWVVRFERNQVFVEQTDAFNIREDQVPATGPVLRP
ncbi:MAG: energy transducer TonB [Limnochordales bacterium]|nr:energy transducer TonB [Limnochordales bacterium]